MLIDRVDLYFARLPLKAPYVIADREQKHCDTVFLRLESEGCAGWSEVTPGNFSCLTSEWSSGVYESIKENLMPVLAEIFAIQDGENLNEILSPIKGNRHAKAAFDMAYWDLQARQNSEPLWKTLGGSKKPIDLGLTFDRMEDHDLFYKELGRAFDENFRRLTMKLRPGWDIQAINALRSESPFFIDLIVDVEGALDLNQHSEILARLDDFLPAMIEQPLAPCDLVAHAMMQEQTRTILALDESIETPEQAEIAIDLQACRAFSMKPGRVGGFTPAKKITTLAEQADLPCYGSFDLQSSIGYRQLLALASLPNFTKPCDYVRLDEVLLEDPGKPVTCAERTVPASENKEERVWKFAELWEEPGLGCDPDPDILEKCTIKKESWARRM